ncbi:MAG TPA: glycoside hydrolase family 2 TIM barrel-domain containing protein [Armatimonadota bacterium]|nr:glycoside hydrolase family 2 TIM barrel-domain containing protein [Armatimonadota bacterium]
MHFIRQAMLLGALIFFTPLVLLARENRFYFVSNEHWEDKVGFFFYLGNTTATSARCALATTTLDLGVADGKTWRLPTVTTPWEFERDYQAKAVITPTTAQLWLDGKCLATTDGAFCPSGQPMLLSHVPGWATAPTEYAIELKSLTIASSKKTKQFSFPYLPPEQAAKFFYPLPGARAVDWPTKASDTLTITAVFRFHRFQLNVQQIAPLIDQYGQCNAAEWQGKIHQDTDLHTMLAQEEKQLAKWGVAKGYDEFGGNTTLGWHVSATGFFTVAQHNGNWWLISPKGNPCFYRGVCAATVLADEKTPVTGREQFFTYLPPKDGIYKPLWRNNVWGNDAKKSDYVSFQGLNLIRKFGEQWQDRSTQLMRKRLLAWGFSGHGKWVRDNTANLPYMPVLGRWGVPNLVNHPDIFDAKVCQTFVDYMKQQIDPHKNDPSIIGWSLGNEAGEIISRGEIQQIFQRSGDIPAKRALITYALHNIYGDNLNNMAAAWGVTADTAETLYANTSVKIPAADQEKLRQYYAGCYYKFIYTTVKTLDPNHLYFACWVMGTNLRDTDADWLLQAQNADVLGFDNYDDKFANTLVQRCLQKMQKPVLLGEFSFPTWDRGLHGYGNYGTFSYDQRNAGEKYTRLVKEAATNPYCIGVFWFEYRDQDVTGRGSVDAEGGMVGDNLVFGEHYAFGLVDVTDTPKWQFVEQVRKVNLAVDQWRNHARQ